MIKAVSRVPQGFHLGFSFLTFINDIASVFEHNQFLLFADDLKVYTRISNADDVLNLQHDLARLCKWCQVNRLSLNISKCRIVSFSRAKKASFYRYSLNNFILPSVGRVPDLGVTFLSNLSFNEHFHYVLNKSYKVLGFLMICYVL